VTGLAVELNPLGWPWGILGAFAFYGPALVFAYLLLFRIKEKHSLYAALPLTLLTLAMIFINIFGEAQNFQVFIDTAIVAEAVRSDLFSLLATMDLVVPMILFWIVAHQKGILKRKYS
jgi:uncharacterized membrane protein